MLHLLSTISVVISIIYEIQYLSKRSTCKAFSPLFIFAWMGNFFSVVVITVSLKVIAPAKLLVTPSFIPNQQASKDKQIFQEKVEANHVLPSVVESISELVRANGFVSYE